MTLSEVCLDHQSLFDHKRHSLVYKEKPQWCEVCAPCQSATIIIYHNERKTCFFACDFEERRILMSFFPPYGLLTSEIN